MSYSSVMTPKTAKISVSRQTNLGVADYDLNELYSPDTALWKSKVLDLASPKYSPNKTYIFDKSRYNNHGTLNLPIWARLPRGLWCLDYDGTDDKVEIPYSPLWSFGTGNFTCLAWVNVDVITGDKNVIGWHTSDANGGWCFTITLAKLQAWVYFAGGGGWKDPTLNHQTSLVAGTWYLTGLRRLGSEFSVWLNGIKGTAPYTNAAAITNAVNSSLWLGARYGGTASRMNGKIAPSLVCNVGLSDAGMLNIYNQEKHLLGV